MTVETDVRKEVIAIEEKCGSDINSGQDLVSSDCNGSDVNPDNSYVFVSETDGLGDDHVQTKERDSESVIEPETLKGDHIENVAVNGDPVVNEQVEGDVLERQGGEVDECGVSDVEIVANNDENVGKVVESESDQVEVANGGVESSVVTDLGGLSSDQNGNLGNVEGLNEVIESSAGDHEDGILQDGVKSYGEKAKGENIMVENGDHQDEILQDEVKSDGEEAKDDIGTDEQSDHQDRVLQDEATHDGAEAKDEIGTVESSDPEDGILQDEANSNVKQAKDETGMLESGDHQDGSLQDVEKCYVEQPKDERGTVERLEGSETEVVADPNGNLENVDNEIERVDDTNERIDSSISEEIREGVHQNVNSSGEAKSDIERAQDASRTLESLNGSESEVVAVPNENVQNVDVDDIKQAGDQSERTKSLGEADMETVSDQPEKLESVARTEIRELEDPNEIVGSLGVAESELVSEQHEKIEQGAESEIKEVEDVDEISESLAGDETEKARDRENEVAAESVNVADCENDGESETELVADHKDESLAGDETEKAKDRENEVVSQSVNVADQKNDGESETKLMADHKDDGAAEAEIVTNKSNESAVEVEKVVADQKNDHEFETEMLADHKNEGLLETETVTDEANESVVETEKASDQTNEGAVETENVTDQTNECGAKTELQKFVDQVEPESSAEPIDNQESQVQKTELFNESANDNSESGVCEESQSVIDDSIESEFQELSSKGQYEIKLAETVNDEVPPATAMVTDIEARPVDSNVETLEEQANVALVSDAAENQKYEIESVVQPQPQQVDEVETVANSDDKQVEIVRGIPEETVEKNISVSHVEEIAQNDEEHEKPLDVNSVSSKLAQTENEIEASVPAQLTVSGADMPHSDIDVPGSDTGSFSPVDSPKSQIVETGRSNHESIVRGTGTTNDARSESNSVPNLTVSAETEQTLVNGDEHVEPDVSHVKPETFTNQPDSVDVKLESGSNLVSETDGVEDTGNQVDSPKATTGENLDLQRNMDTENSQSEGVSGASKEDSSTSTINENETSIAAVIRPFNYIMRVPRFNDESLKERIIQAKLQIEEKTKVRDAIQSQIQQIRANGQIHGVDYEYAKSEIRNARKLLRAKRVEIDSLHSVINKAKNAISIDDIDTRIYSMEHMMQHETLPLKEEKQFIREIKQLKSLRDELSSNMGSDDEIKQALEQREEAEERLKILRKELEKLKGDVQKAESSAMEAERKYEDENKKVKELQAQFRAANDVRQEAYAQWLSLRKELSEKNKYFFKYKDDNAAANNYAFRRDRESLYRLCTDQVEQLMELWNTDEAFRKEYVSYNVRSTVRRFGTLDGRALSPDEEPPILPSYVDERFHRFVSTPTNTNTVSKSVMELKSEVTVEKGTVNDKSVKKSTENVNKKVKSKETAEPVLANGLPTAASLQAPDEVMNEPVKSREEIELDRKAEEMRKKEDEAKLKEQRRLEGLAKANEARERKKRQAEKMQVRAELKARKEAEEKEKEREKRLRKKEKKKGTDSIDGNNNSDSAPSSESAIETVREIDAKEMASVVAKKPQKVVKSNKKVSSIPAHIRNRNKKKWQNYAYVTVAGILVLILFWVGNVSLFTDKTFKKPNPFH